MRHLRKDFKPTSKKTGGGVNRPKAINKKRTMNMDEDEKENSPKTMTRNDSFTESSGQEILPRTRASARAATAVSSYGKDFKLIFKQYLLKAGRPQLKRKAKTNGDRRARSRSVEPNSSSRFGDNDHDLTIRPLSSMQYTDDDGNRYDDDDNISLGLSRQDEQVLEKTYQEYINLLYSTGTDPSKVHEVASYMGNLSLQNKSDERNEEWKL